MPTDIPKSVVARVVLGLHILFVVASAIAVFIAALEHSLPASWQANAALAVGLLTAIGGATAGVVKFLDGSQKHDALMVDLAKHNSSTAPDTSVVFGDTPVVYDPSKQPPAMPQL